jgi:lipoprotein LprG
MSRRAATLLAAAALLAAGCASDSGGGTTLPPDAATILDAAATAMGAVDTVRFTIERTGAPVYIDDSDLLAFVSAEGRYATPGSAEAVVTIDAGGVTTQIGAVAIEGETWLSNPITGAWEPAPIGYTFDPATLFDPAVGWRPLLAGGLTGVTLVGEGTEDGRYHLQGTADQERVAVITAGMVSGQSPLLDLWVDATTGEVTDVSFPTSYRGDLSDWTLAFFDYGADVEITPPDLPDGG